MNDKLISVIVPVYKVEKYLNQCVESIVRQTYTDLEIILVDDGSPDGSPEICDAWAERDPRIRVIHKVNGGAASARNAGLDISTGDYIGFVDSDDYIAESMYEEMLNAIVNTDKKMSCCSAFRTSEDGIIEYEERERKRCELGIVETLEKVLQYKVGTSFWRRLFHKDVFANLRFPVGEVNEEFPLLIPATVMSNGMIHIGKSMYYYRGRQGSITNGAYIKSNNAGIVYDNLERIKEQLKEYGLLHELKKNYLFFAAQSAYSMSISMEKNYCGLDDIVKGHYQKYRKMMMRSAPLYVLSRDSRFKDKVLYILILTKLLRPVYRIIGKKL